jgi:homoserine kinase type II
VAVYTDIRDDELREHLTLYELGGLHSLKGIAEGVENSNFMLATDAGHFILTLYEKRVNPADLPFFLGLMDYLSARGINCPRPVPMRSGEMLGTLAGKPAAIVTFLDGFSVRRPAAVHCRQVGEALAKMHLAAAEFPIRRPNALTLENWRPLAARSAGRAQEVEAGLAQFIDRELDFLEANWPASLPRGVIHADLFRDNVFFLNDALSGVIDFYFACNDILAYDLSVSMNAWCFEQNWEFNVTKARAMLEGYDSVRPLSAAEFEAMPVLARGSAMRFLLTRLYDWLNVPPGALVVPHDPREYLAKLRFHQGINRAASYGLDFQPRETA